MEAVMLWLRFLFVQARVLLDGFHFDAQTKAAFISHFLFLFSHCFACKRIWIACFSCCCYSLVIDHSYDYQLSMPILVSVQLLILGVNLKSFPSSSVHALFSLLFHAGIAAILLLYVLFWLKVLYFSPVQFH